MTIFYFYGKFFRNSNEDFRYKIKTKTTLSVPIFAFIYFCEVKNRISRVLIFANGKFLKILRVLLRMASFWKFRVYKFQPQRKKKKKKTVETRQIHDGKTSYWLILEKAKLTKIYSLCIFPCIYFREIWIFCIFGVYLFPRMPFKSRFRVYLILQNWPKFAKYAKICTHEN